MEQLLRLPSPPDAVFCYNDLLAVGAMRTVLRRGLRVPQDVAVAGFDDIEEGPLLVPRPLITISPELPRGRGAIERDFGFRGNSAANKLRNFRDHGSEPR